MVRGALLALLLLATPAMATPRIGSDGIVTITKDEGGLIYPPVYQQAWATIARRGIRVRIDGECTSACTTVLGIVPRENVCVTPQARFGFHKAMSWSPATGWIVDDYWTNMLITKYYPPVVRAWLKLRVLHVMPITYMPASVLVPSWYRWCK